MAVRCGGPNSGHTVTFGDGQQIVLRQIPAGIVNPNTKLFLAAGCLINLEVLFEEMKIFNLFPERLKIDKHAVIIDEEDIKKEKDSNLRNRIGSTCSGVGIAVAKRLLRKANVKLAKDIPELEAYITDVSKEIQSYNREDKDIVIEGTQGFGLSLYHSPYYPCTTSRDTTAAGFLSEVGISPLEISDIIMVIRTFPIRVEGNSGPLPKEISWKTIQGESGYPHMIEEYTSVTKRTRRVARFDLNIVKKAFEVNKPTHIALMGIDYLDYENKGKIQYSELTKKTRDFISWVEEGVGSNISFIGTGPKDNEVIDMVKVRKNDRERERKIIGH